MDADNTIDAEAIEHTLAIAIRCDEKTAVVHPLIKVVDKEGRASRLLGGGHAWLESQLEAGNCVDAMALIRKGAWEDVGGYTHIPGGWEDYDFWCKLIEAGWYGVLCPKVLATYTEHQDSMLQQYSNNMQRRLSTILKARHPWLKLKYNGYE